MGKKKLGLLGYPLGHSYSREWFMARGWEFENFEYAECADFFKDFKKGGLRGFGVTIPHKRTVMGYLDSLDRTAVEADAVNCVVVGPDGHLRGYNTDTVGFMHDFRPLTVGKKIERAAVLGSGGASGAVAAALRQLSIEPTIISRGNNGYQTLQPADYQAIINTTPLGMHPDLTSAPPIDYPAIRPGTICYDLVYNPALTRFLALCKAQGAVVKGGIGMLTSQAEAALRHYED